MARVSISECTTFPASYEDDLAAYAAGFANGIGIWESKLPAGDDDRSIERLRASGLAVSVCVPAVPSVYPDSYFTQPADPRERTAALCEGIRRLARFEPATVMVVAGDPTGRDRAEMHRVTVEGLREGRRRGQRAGAPARAGGLPRVVRRLVSSIPGMLGLADLVGRSNALIVPDLWHIWDDPGVLDDLRIHVDRFAAVQICDWREPTRSWADRVLPGDGVIDWAAVYGALQAGGFDSWLDFEIFSDDGRFGNDWPDSIWKRDPTELATDAVGRVRRGWETRTSGVA